MANWCLTKEAVLRFKKGLKDREIDPFKLAVMTSEERNTFLAKYVGVENAQQTNALFESKLLLKNQKAGYQSWAKKIGGITPQTRQDLMSKIERMDRVLNPEEEAQFLHDLAVTRLKINITAEEARKIFNLSKAVREKRAVANTDGTFPSKEQKMDYGISQVEMENYVNELKLKSASKPFREAPLGKLKDMALEIPGVMKSVVASLDNSFFGRQGIKVLYTHPTVWVNAFARSWVDLVRQVTAKGKWYKEGNDVVLDSIKADIYSRPNALNGKYKAGGYMLDALTEEAYPSSLPAKIPLLGRLFKASEAMYNGAALRMRSDLADKLIKQADDFGVNTLVKDQAQPLGNMIGSLTGRGAVNLSPGQAKLVNNLFFSLKFLFGNIQTLTGASMYGVRKITGFKNKGEEYAGREAAKNLLKIIATLAFILTTAKILDPNSVDEDPRSTNFGKVKIFGHWTDITGGLGSLIVLASRLTPTMHNGEWGFWNKNSNGDYTDLGLAYGKPTPLDVLEGFMEGKLSPSSGILRDIWKRKTFSGQPVTIQTELLNQVPLSIQSLQNFMQDPASTFVLGSMILEGLGLSTSNTVAPNQKTQLLPEGKAIKNENVIAGLLLYADAIGTDPETAFNRILTGQKITRVSNGTVIVERMPLADSTAVKKKANANNPTMKLDHTIPLELGGSNDMSNLKLVPTSQWSSYTKVENALGAALKKGKISKTEAQNIIKKFKAITSATDRKTYGNTIIIKYK
jgi:hypothetical protein